jgi:hypothetical protein
MRIALVLLFFTLLPRLALAQQPVAPSSAADQAWTAPRIQPGSEMDVHIAASATVLGLGSAALVASVVTFFGVELSCFPTCSSRNHTATLALAIGGGSAAAVGLVWLLVAVALQNAERAEPEQVWRVAGGFDSNGGWLGLNGLF